MNICGNNPQSGDNSLTCTECHQAISGASGEKSEAQQGELSAQLPTLQQYHHKACRTLLMLLLYQMHWCVLLHITSPLERTSMQDRPAHCTT